MLSHRPLCCGHFTKESPTVHVVDPIRVGHPWLDGIELLVEFPQASGFANKFVEPVLNRSIAAAIRSAGIDRIERVAFDCKADELTDQGLARSAIESPAEIHGHLQRGLRGCWITRLPVGICQSYHVLAQLL